jgi:hypothetical protein
MDEIIKIEELINKIWFLSTQVTQKNEEFRRAIDELEELILSNEKISNIDKEKYVLKCLHDLAKEFSKEFKTRYEAVLNTQEQMEELKFDIEGLKGYFHFLSDKIYLVRFENLVKLFYKKILTDYYERKI